MILLLLLLIIFLPWTQNIKSKGNVTTLRQEQRPQKINALIPGKINQWFIKEGDFVKKGDTILILSEIKEEYLNPELIGNTQIQLNAKNESIDAYKEKIKTIEKQISNLKESKSLKLMQLKNKQIQLDNKLTAEQAELVANENETKLLKNQYERQLKMYEEGLVSQTQLQQRNIQYQNTLAKISIIESKIAQTRQDLLNNRIEQNVNEQEYAEKIIKSEGDKFLSLSQIATSQGDAAKLKNQVSNYTIRNDRYVVTAPQSGQIIRANKSGIGEILKEGEPIAMIVPEDMEYAVEIFINPVDLPLIHVGQSVRFTFDGFPAIVFSGWPQNSYGTFGGKIVAYENSLGENGKYRVLVAEDPDYKKWPSQIRVGIGAKAIILLKNVPIWYELWRNINGFPADFYIVDKKELK